MADRRFQNYSDVNREALRTRKYIHSSIRLQTAFSRVSLDVLKPRSLGNGAIIFGIASSGNQRLFVMPLNGMPDMRLSTAGEFKFS